jgi:regulator of protease activity HflC (stomatin/prohibitin superfamily)
MSVDHETILAVKRLTGREVVDCKKAIEAANGDFEKAFKWLKDNPTGLKKNSINAAQPIPSVYRRQPPSVAGQRPDFIFKEYKMSFMIRKHERYLLYRKGEYVKLLKPGKQRIPPFLGYTVERYDTGKPFVPPQHFNLYSHDKSLLEELDIIDVKDNEIALHFEDGHFAVVLQPGKYYFWNNLVEHKFITVNLDTPGIGENIDKSLLQLEQLTTFLAVWAIEPYEKGLLFFNSEFQKILEPGKYYYWNSTVSAAVHKVDMRQLQLDMTGQEIMTKDKVTIRVNFICQYKIADPLIVLTGIKNYEEQLYILMQLILREYVGTFTLDELLGKKEEIGAFVLEALEEKGKSMGLTFLYAGVKDIVLPGEIKTILNQVLEAEKKAQANIITRREETASTRSLLNTAKLMEDNPTLMKLKELEHIERISDKISSLTLNGGSQILEQLKKLFGGV